MNKNCIIVHGCPSNEEDAKDPEKRTYDKHWIPWTKKKLEENGIPTQTPIMPEPWTPVYEKFKAEFEKLTVNENTVLVGHSCGCAFLVRWLGENKINISKLVMVAPYKVNDKGGVERDRFYGFPIDETINDRVGEIVMFTADDEREGGKESIKLYKASLDVKVIELKGHGHFCYKNMGTDEFPELIQEILK